VIQFPVSGVDCPFWLPPLVAFIISSLTSTAGVSGAFLILPFEVSYLRFTGPAVSPTNLVFNIVAIPGGIYRYIREGRMAWPLTWTVVVGTFPGIFAGAIIRIKYLPDARSFKLFVGLVLLYLGGRIIYELSGRARRKKELGSSIEKKFQLRTKEAKEKGLKGVAGLSEDAVVKTKSVSIGKIEYEFWGETFSFNPIAVFILSLAVGLIGGVYGIGGGAIIAPFLVSFMGLPVYTVAGAALAGTFVTSVGGVAFYEILSFTSIGASAQVRPDWALGALFGIGGLLGTYTGARLQKFIPELWIKVVLGVLVTFLAVRYIIQFFI
jgi:hypothetical protein